MINVTRTLSANDIHSIYAVTGLAHDQRASNPHTPIRYTSLESHRRPKPETPTAWRAPSDHGHHAR